VGCSLVSLSNSSLQWRNPRQLHAMVRGLGSLKRILEAVWHRSQIGHRSEYSVERLLAFRDYYERTSLARAVAVCILVPAPAVVVTLAIDSIPLRPPSDGWRANYAVWIRLLLAIFAEALGVAFQVRAVVLPGAITNVGAVKIALATSISSVLATMAVAATWEFPIPFGYVIMLNLYISFFIVYMLWFTRAENFSSAEAADQGRNAHHGQPGRRRRVLPGLQRRLQQSLWK